MNNPTAYFRLNHLRETLQLLAQALGFGGVVVLDGVLQKRVQPLDRLNRIVSLSKSSYFSIQHDHIIG